MFLIDDFDKSVTVSTSEVSVDVNFEPSTLGDTHATLSISSPTGNIYIYIHVSDVNMHVYNDTVHLYNRR